MVINLLLLNYKYSLTNFNFKIASNIKIFSYIICFSRHFTWRIWCACCAKWGLISVMPNVPRVAYESWLGGGWSRSHRRKWLPWFFVISWSIWEQRNKVIFQQGTISWDSCLALVTERAEMWSKVLS